jgi:hypothetical protein
MSKLSFAGHETFICKQFWLKKGYDYLKSNDSFGEKEAISALGVGKNMVSAIQFWMKAFGLLLDDNKTLTSKAHYLFDEKTGKDLFLEDLGSVWLLHYFLIKTNRSSIYNIVFNDFRKERFEFTKDILFNFIKRKCEAEEIEVSPNTLNSDINVFLKTYSKPDASTERIEIEDAFIGLLLDLDLVKSFKKINLENKSVDWYKISNEDRADLPFHLVLYVILDMLDDQKNGTSISFKELQQEPNAPMLVFALTPDCLFDKLQEITDYYKGDIIYSETAGVQVLQFKSSKITKDSVLNDYYK